MAVNIIVTTILAHSHVPVILDMYHREIIGSHVLVNSCTDYFVSLSFLSHIQCNVAWAVHQVLWVFIASLIKSTDKPCGLSQYLHVYARMVLTHTHTPNTRRSRKRQS